MKLESGALALIDNSRQAVYGYDQRAEVFGSLGAVESRNDSPSTAVLSTSDGIISEKPLYFFLERYMESFSTEMRYFIESVRTGGPTVAGAVEALRSVQIAVAAKESQLTGKPVKIRY